MSRILLVLIFVFWMAAPHYAQTPSHDAWIGVAIFLGYYVLLVLVMGIWGRLLARRVSATNLRRKLRRYNVTLLIARAMIPVWFAFGIFGLGWGEVVHRAIGTGTLGVAQLPSLLLATLPAMAAWMGLWWSQYPAEVALREQGMLGAFEADLPVYSPPPFRDYFLSNVRLRLLFTVVPIFLIYLLRDVLLLVARLRPFGLPEDTLENVAMIGSVAVVFLFAPEILRRVLNTARLEDGPLRRRLEEMCKASKMRCRDILIWRTHSNVGNAAVMGLIPQMRYVLLSDLLLETMTDEQIEAVFAHEMGHVVHRHMAWFVLFFATIMTSMNGAIVWLQQHDVARQLPEWSQPILVAGGFFWVLGLFGFLSRRFERQADVYAARTMQKRHAERAAAMISVASLPGNAIAASDRAHVGAYGAMVFASALERVAVVNNMPTGTHGRWEGNLRQRLRFLFEQTTDLMGNWLHGSIQDRQAYIRRLSEEPSLTHRFDRFMSRLYSTLVFLLAASIAFCVALQW